jgi:hypothetical protein
MPKKQDLLPETQFHRLKVLTKSIKVSKNNGSYYHCECSCGALVEVSRSCLVTEKTKSCGCWLRLSPSNLFKQAPGNASHNNLYNRCAKGARVRGLEFNLSREKHAELIVMNCHYCNRPAPNWNVYASVYTKKKRTKLHPKTFEDAWIKAHGLDRVDSNLGYIESNVVTCCKTCNYAKLDMSYQEYIDHCYSVSEFQRSKSSA